jgi:FMN phosphatase YigB (HAD superfamily)
MIKAVLLDLDDTLITTHTETFFAGYLNQLSQYVSARLPAFGTPDRFLNVLMGSFGEVVAAADSTRTLYVALMDRLAQRTGLSAEEMSPVFDAFYRERYPEIVKTITPRAESRRLLECLISQGYRIAVATNPGLPETAIRQRMAAGDVPAEAYPYELLTSLETMHFGKPHPEYYAEILLRLDLHPCEAIMVGDDWDNDVVGAAAIGMHTFWLAEPGSVPPDKSLRLSGSGSYAQFASMVESGWLGLIEPKRSECEALLTRLAAFPAVVAHLVETYSRDVLECRPAEDEWSVRDTIDHLRDHDLNERQRLSRILDADNPFLSTVATTREDTAPPRGFDVYEALHTFATERKEMVNWLRDIPDEKWDRPARDAIFGPTTFEEMVRFVAAHDRTHLHQMQDSIVYALGACGTQEEREAAGI